ncbi:MAG: flippase-like domain-containing protein [Calditrichaeota bacterium]|nr:flippase-like domain-containing protein [Calditrichota bacterium]
MPDILKNRLIFAAKYLIGFILLAWILARVDRQNMVSILLSVNAGTLLNVLILALINLFLQFRLWKFLVESHSVNFQIKDILPSFFAGFAFRLMIPGGHAEITKIFLLPGPKRGKAIAFGIEKFFQTVFKIVLVLIALPIVLPEYQFILLSSAGLLLAGFIILPFYLKNERFSRFQEKNVSYKRIFLAAFLHTVPIFLSLALQYHILLNDSFSISFFETSIVTVFIWGAGLIPVSVSGLGVRENIAVLLLAKYGVPGAGAVGISLLLFFINAILPAIAGVFIIIRRRNDIKGAGGEIKKVTKNIIENRKNRQQQKKNRQQTSTSAITE